MSHTSQQAADEIDRLRKAVEDWHDCALQAERHLELLQKCCTQRGARMQIMRDWIASCSEQDDWRQFVSRTPSAGDWFDQDGVPVDA